MSVLNFIIESILTQAAITIGLIAFIGLLLQRKQFGEVMSGSFKTMLGFMVLSAGSAIIVDSLTYFGEIFTEAFGMQGIVPSIEAINGQAMSNLGLGNQIALTFLAIFIFNIIIARITKWKYIFLTGQAILWMATMTIIFGSAAGFSGITLILFGGLIGGIFAVAMPAIAQPIVRKITGSDDIALGHFCTIGYLFGAGVAKLIGKGSKSIEDIKFPKGLSFLSDTYLSVAFVMVHFTLLLQLLREQNLLLNYLVMSTLLFMHFCKRFSLLLVFMYCFPESVYCWQKLFQLSGELH